MKSCKKGYKVSLNDSHKRCIKIINRSVCSKLKKQYNTITKKCNLICKNNQILKLRKDKRGTRCIKKCGKNQERGTKFCRKKCKKSEKRVKRNDGRGTRCIRK